MAVDSRLDFGLIETVDAKQFLPRFFPASDDDAAFPDAQNFREELAEFVVRPAFERRYF